MKIKFFNLKFLVFLCTSVGLITSCNNPEPTQEFHVELINSNCNVSGIKDTYSENEKVTIHIDPISDLYYRPTYKNLGVYGVTHFAYDENIGDLIFNITNNVTLNVKGEPRYGEEVTRDDFCAMFGLVPKEDNPYGDIEPQRKFIFYKYEFWWDFSSVTNEDVKLSLFSELSNIGLRTNTLSGHLFENSESPTDLNAVKTYAYNEEAFNKNYLASDNDRYFFYHKTGTQSTAVIGNAYLNNFEIFKGYPNVPSLVTFRFSANVSENNGTRTGYEIHFNNYDFNDYKLNGYLKFAGYEMEEP